MSVCLFCHVLFTSVSKARSDERFIDRRISSFVPTLFVLGIISFTELL